MKKMITAILLLINMIVIAQIDTSFYGLRGYENLEGNTQLFYRVQSDSSAPKGNGNYKGVNRNDIYHFDIDTNIDSLFILDYIDFYQPLPAIGHTVSDFEFVDNTLTDFYQCGDGVTSFEPSPIVVYNREYNNSFEVNSFHGTTNNLEIIKSDTNIKVYVSTDDGIYSGLLNGAYDLIKSTEGFRLVSINKIKPNVMFVENADNYLLKSIDTGKTFFIVDSTNYLSSKQLSADYLDYINRWFLYDSDSSHIYRIGRHGENNYYLLVSDNFGEESSWYEKFESESELFLTYDSTQSGLLYVASGKEIYESDNYGETFQLFKKVKQRIKGIYKKPNSDLLYVTTSHSLLEINSDTTKILKQTVDYDALSYYPLHVGDKWQYSVEKKFNKGKSDTSFFYETKVVRLDTIQGESYFVLNHSNRKKENYLRIDTANAIILQFDYGNKQEFVKQILSLEVGNGFVNKHNLYTKCINDTVERVFNNSSNMKIFESTLLITCMYVPRTTSKYVQGLGKVFSSTIFPAPTEPYDIINTKLIFAKINGKTYGDSIVVEIEKPKKNILTKYSLAQNYPNPFNPTTTIKYTIPVGTRQALFPQNVQIKVYNILGEEVTTLVNKMQNPGNYEVVFDATNLSSGVYYYQLKSGSFVKTKKMVILK